jgi:hypothetical protein
MNDRSSRSHACFTISLLQQSGDGHSARSSQLCIVDLAGSERLKKSLVEGQTLDEAVAINKSLHALGWVAWLLPLLTASLSRPSISELFILQATL